jgi:hypothetical protein
MGTNHFDRNSCHRFLFFDSDSFSFEDSAKSAHTQLFAQFQSLTRELPLAVIGQQLGLFINGQVRVDALRVAVIELAQLFGSEEGLTLLLTRNWTTILFLKFLIVC